MLECFTEKKIHDERPFLDPLERTFNVGVATDEQPPSSRLPTYQRLAF